ncbi:GMC oxidoreductase [Parafrankia sp. EUN1f]|uniref:GMC oxidoreductase n=1 Tax=Parafrankia sp. EUN1f TaxID=102897 RepID=UPI0001C46CA0|nr:GMC oxidoreductase [Parafrankia sp. EUN1f]EFC80446.1 FAD dependent oxidoreductase [Parafrankia sp. EUN1f]
MTTGIEHADVVVVGSGFGGSVSAFRFAAAGRSVVLLERGKAYPPGSFARSPADMSTNFWDPSRGRYGLFDVWSFRHFGSVVSSGLGGGSLIYANVMLRKDEHWFVRDAPAGEGYESWPVTRADLDPHYDAVERMLAPQRFPRGGPGYEAARRTELLEQAGRALGWTVERPPLAVTFAAGDGPPTPGMQIPTPAYGNYHGRPRITCVMCGECDLGCNYGSKNSLDHTYLSAAHTHGADLRLHHEVRSITPRDGGGYTVGYVVHDPNRPRATADLPTRTLTCDRLVLAAGTFGTTYLLLRNRAALPGLSRQLGRRFSANGDLLGFVHGVPGLPLGASDAPVITSCVRLPDALDQSAGGGVGGRGPSTAGGRGVYVEDAGYPMTVEWLLEATRVESTARRAVRAAEALALSRLRWAPSRRIGAIVGDLLGPGTVSAGAMPLLGMGRDLPLGVISVRDDCLQVDRYLAGNRPYYDDLRGVMDSLAEQLGGRFTDDPLTWLSQVVTVHPLGGAPMGADVATGVVDSYGEVFGHPGLYVADGAAIPGPVGANPSMTIAAFADRLADQALSIPLPSARTAGACGRAGGSGGPAAARADATAQERARGAGTAGPPGGSGEPSTDGPMPSAAAHAARRRDTSRGAVALRFTETMRGFFAFDETDPRRACDQGRVDGARLVFRLTIETDDVDAFLADPRHPAAARGYVDCDALGGRRPVVGGEFNLFVASAGGQPGGPAAPPVRARARARGRAENYRMCYRLPFTDAAGHPLTLGGFKVIQDDGLLDVWRDTTTLYTTVYAGHVGLGPGADPLTEPDAPVVGAGILTIHPLDFVRQLATFRNEPAGPAGRAALARFGAFFAGDLRRVYAPFPDWRAPRAIARRGVPDDFNGTYRVAVGQARCR